MKTELETLFDYQRFERNASLETLIQETENRFDRELSDEALDIVFAAGEITEKIRNTADITAPPME